jgi:two-component system NtrC family sensor kinase
VALLLATAVSFALLNSILKPLKKLRTAIEEIASGPELNDVRIVHAPPEIEALVKRFNSMQGVIRERRRLNQEKLMHSDRLATIGQLAAGVAHEINNPLGSILLFSRLVMQQVPADSSIRENVERIEKESRRCHSIIQSLLGFARRREPRVEVVDINRLLDETLKLFESQYTFQNVEVHRDFNCALPAIQADHAQLQQVFMNIIINATDAMAGKGRLTIETGEGKEEEHIEIVISDTGCGIPPENIERIFDPFFTTKGVGHGTGLGLSVSYGIIRRHNGEIIVSSTVGMGSSFTIILPKMEENV